jgi:acetyltransferase
MCQKKKKRLDGNDKRYSSFNDSFQKAKLLQYLLGGLRVTNIEPIKAFMEPKSIALIGVSRNTGEDSFNILENLLHYGFSGKVFPVNPSADQILGIKSYPNVKDIPEDIDIAVIASPRSTVLNLVKECADKHVKGIVIVAQGFADGDEEGNAMQREMVKTAREAGARIMGPNSLGIANSFCNLNTSFAFSKMDKVPVGIICQSGLFFPGPPRLILAAKAIDLGNACDIDVSDGLEYFETDPDIKLITLYIEGIKDGRRFIDVARRVAKKKPIVALKSGRGEYGAIASKSHTGSLAGRDEIYDAVFNQCGVIRAADIEELTDLARTFSCLPLIKGRGIGIISMSGAGGVIAADMCQQHKLDVAELSSETLAQVKRLFPPWLAISNPFDAWPAFQVSGRPYKEVVSRAFNLMLADESVNGIVFISGIFGKQESWDISQAILQAVDAVKNKPVVCWLYGDHDDVQAKLEESGKVAVLPSCERAVRALARLREYAEFLEKNP